MVYFAVKMLNRKKSSAAEATSHEPNPYLDAQRAWTERYGSYVAQAYNWRLLAMLEAIGLLAAIIGLIYVATQTKFVPYVVAIDKVGAAFAVFPAERASSIDQRVVHAELGQFISYARTITADRALEKISLERAFNYLDATSPSRQFMVDYYPKNDPFERAKSETVQVQVNNVLPVSPTSYEIQWTETIRDKSGSTKRDENWEATCEVAFKPPQDEATMLKNPLGLYIETINWEKK